MAPYASAAAAPATSTGAWVIMGAKLEDGEVEEESAATAAVEEPPAK